MKTSILSTTNEIVDKGSTNKSTLVTVTVYGVLFAGWIAMQLQK